VQLSWPAWTWRAASCWTNPWPPSSTNHVLELVLSRADGGKSPPLKQVLDRPLTNVVNPGSKQWEILEIEENLKTAGWPTERMVREMTKLANLYANLNQAEKAISTLQGVDG
jgi:hypothetical protein